MAAALFAERTGHLADPVRISSAGLRPGGRSVPDEVLEVMGPMGVDLRRHRSSTLTAELLGSADLVIGMGRRHVQEAVLLDPACWPMAFKLKELVRRAEAIGPRPPDAGIRSWIDAVHGDRTRFDLAHLTPEEEVADPYGGELEGYRTTAAELDDLTTRLAGLMWPREPEPRTGSPSSTR